MISRKIMCSQIAVVKKKTMTDIAAEPRMIHLNDLACPKDLTYFSHNILLFHRRSKMLNSR